MGSPYPHENDSTYDWHPSSDVPDDLVEFYREFKPGHWAYVCPCCHYVYGPGFAGMPGGFRAHVRDYLRGGGCFFAPKAIPLRRAGKHQSEAADF